VAPHRYDWSRGPALSTADDHGDGDRSLGGDGGAVMSDNVVEFRGRSTVPRRYKFVEDEDMIPSGRSRVNGANMQRLLFGSSRLIAEFGRGGPGP